ncbi:hypothetical protein SISNIDRAFT_282648 [Sistotremastrum niveocremeum HHB9708]|uniref:Uncharacterized protein n=1 Tax=Sistotremastrum niveocremeum HHB9708 TaxID=1314777 RepID=A0A164Y885_9AGAM|nr:hypothetical protein SISNIDRAFT_282648 [Sistotremastrum niveocremeum HHB9708]
MLISGTMNCWMSYNTYTIFSLMTQMSYCSSPDRIRSNPYQVSCLLNPPYHCERTLLMGRNESIADRSYSALGAFDHDRHLNLEAFSCIFWG